MPPPLDAIPSPLLDDAIAKMRMAWAARSDTGELAGLQGTLESIIEDAGQLAASRQRLFYEKLIGAAQAELRRLEEHQPRLTVIPPIVSS
jgi:hypothetical protein